MSHRHPRSRAWLAPVAVLLAVRSVVGCATDEEEQFFPDDPRLLEDASTGGAAGGSGAAGAGGAGTGGGVPQGTCRAEFCPEVGTGRACCVTSQGPCGVDEGSGCRVGGGGSGG